MPRLRLFLIAAVALAIIENIRAFGNLITRTRVFAVRGGARKPNIQACMESFLPPRAGGWSGS